MSFELLLTWGALLYTLILPIIYNNKQQFKNTRTTSYKFMLLWSIAFQISEIITIEFMKNGGSDTLVFIFWRIHYIFLIFWVLSVIFCYRWIKWIPVWYTMFCMMELKYRYEAA